MFDNPGVYYTNDPKIIFNNDWVLDADKIKNLTQHNLTVLDFSSEHYGADGLDYVYDALENANVNFLLLVHDPSDHLKFPRMLHYMHWLMWGSTAFTLTNTDKIVRTYKWSCLNGINHPHRIYNLILSRQKPYFADAFFSFHNKPGRVKRLDDVVVGVDIEQEWQKLLPMIPDISKIVTVRLSNADIAIPAYTDSYIHLVTETTVIPKIFVTEKTWKPVAAGQIFLVFGNPGTIAYLRSAGVDVFDDVIDHNYDVEQDWKLRLNKIHLQIEKLLSMNLEELYSNTRERRRANSMKFFDKSFAKGYNAQIAQAINYYLK